MASVQGYSTQVTLALLVNGQEFSVSHVGNSGLMIDQPCEPIPPTQATLVVSIDDKREERSIYLPEGVPGPGQFVSYL